MPEPVELVTLIAGGLAAGWVGGILGIGGGVVMVPILHLIFALPLQTAVGTSLLVITGTSTSASLGYLRDRLIDVDWAVKLGIGALVGAIVASRTAAYLNERTVAVLFSLALVAVAVRMLLPKRKRNTVKDDSETRRPVAALASMPLAGAAAGLLGVGGGIVQVPVIRLLLARPMKVAVATSTLMVGWTAGVAAVAYLYRGQVDLSSVPWLLAGVIVGAGVAPWTLRHLRGRWLEIGFAMVSLYTAWRMVHG